MNHQPSAGMPARIVELLARPRLADLPENPVAHVIDALESAFPDHERVDLPEIVDLAAAREWLGSDPAYIGAERLQRIDGQSVLRYDLSLPMLQATRLDGAAVLRLASGKVYRRETEGPSHLEAFHQFEVLASGAPDLLDSWRFIGSVLRSIDAALPGVATRISPTEYPFCSRAWKIDVEDDDRWVEIMALGQYAPFVVQAMQGDPDRVAAFGAGYGLERMACVRFGIDDIRKVEDARFETPSSSA